MNKEFFAKYRWLMLTILGLIVAMGIVFTITVGMKDIHNQSSMKNLNNIVGKVDENNDIVLTTLSEGTYILYYEDENGIIEDYSEITIVGVRYTGLIKENIAPAEATMIGVYDTLGWRRGSIELGTLAAPELGSKLYCQASISDIHLQQDTALYDFKKAIDYFNTLDDLLFVNICGDLTDGGSAVELAYYKEIRDTCSSKPVYAVSGNHEHKGCIAYDGSDWTVYTGHNLWYTYKQGNDMYIMVGAHGSA